MAHQDALDMITIEEDKEFLIARHKKRRRVLTEKEVRAQKRKLFKDIKS